MALVGVGVGARALFSLSDYVFAMKVQHKHMTPEAAYDYVRSIRPRVKLATVQWKYYHVMVLNIPSSLTDANSEALIPRNVKQVCSVVFDDGSVVVVTHSDVEGYDYVSKRSSMNVAGNELWVKVLGQAALAMISCLWLGRLREDHKLSRKNLSMNGKRVDISVY